MGKEFYIQGKYTNGHEVGQKMLTSLTIRKMQFHTTMRYIYIPSKLAKTKTLIIPSVGEEVEKLEFSYISCGNVTL